MKYTKLVVIYDYVSLQLINSLPKYTLHYCQKEEDGSLTVNGHYNLFPKARPRGDRTARVVK